MNKGATNERAVAALSLTLTSLAASLIIKKAAASREKRQRQLEQERKEAEAAPPAPAAQHRPPKPPPILPGAEDRKISPEPRRPPEKYHIKPYIPGETTILASHMYDPDAPKIEIKVAIDDLQYGLRPKYIPSQANPPEPPIIYLDPIDPSFYMRPPRGTPVFTCWILCKNSRWNTDHNGGGYVKRRLAEEMRRHNIAYRLINPTKCDLLLSESGVDHILYAGEKLPLPDCVIPRVGAAVDYFGVAVMRQLQMLGVLMFNPPDSIEVSRDKLYTHQVMAAKGVPIPKTVLGKKPFQYEFIKQHFGYPLIVKLASGSKGEAVWKVDSEEELRQLSKSFEDSTKPVIFQEFLEATKGRDLRCFVVGDKLVASMMRIAKTGFKANVHQGGSVKPIKVNKPLEDLVVKVSRLCGLDFSGVDLLLDRTGYKVCEVNSSPGFEGLERASGVDVAKHIIAYVVNAVMARKAAGAVTRPADWQNIPLQDDHMLDLKTPVLTSQPQTAACVLPPLYLE